MDIISLKIFVSRHIFLQQKYAFYTTSPSFIVIYTEYLRYLNKERAEKQLLTVNSVNPSCSSALKLYSANSFSAIALPRASHCAFTSGVIACFISTGSPTGS